MSDEKTGVFRLPMKHAPKVEGKPTPADGERIAKAQSVRDAIAAGLVVVIVFSALWAMISTLVGRIFPWMTMVLGIMLGLAVRRAGHGIDWRFPAIAASVALVGSLVGNVVVAAAFTAPELDTTTLTVLRNLTSMTWPAFFSDAMTPADAVFALFGAAIAAFYANRRLTREEYLAVRKWQEQKSNGR